jgi:hypothetical protein
MAWFIVRATIEMEIESPNETEARYHAETILDKRVVGQEFGHRHNDQGYVTDNYEIVSIESNPPECPDCGGDHERGDMECMSPQDIPDDSGLIDPMETER